MRNLLDLVALSLLWLGYRLLSDERFDALYVQMRDDFRA